MPSEVSAPPHLSDSLVFISLNKAAVTWLPALDAESRRWICDVSARTTHVLVVTHHFQSCDHLLDSPFGEKLLSLSPPPSGNNPWGVLDVTHEDVRRGLVSSLWPLKGGGGEVWLVHFHTCFSLLPPVKGLCLDFISAGNTPFTSDICAPLREQHFRVYAS